MEPRGRSGHLFSSSPAIHVACNFIFTYMQLMEINGNPLDVNGSSSTEDLSQYTDADESISAPTEILAEFLSALMVKDYSSALKFCKIILQYEPNHETAKQFYPLIQQKLLSQQANDNENYTLANHLECSSEEDSSETGDENGNNEDGNSDSEESGDQRDAEETTASYSSLEDEIAEQSTLTVNLMKNLSEIETEPMESPSGINTVAIVDDNGNNMPSKTTSTAALTPTHSPKLKQ